jgi:pimeloyl-ACP methyl ester carboxylesterase
MYDVTFSVHHPLEFSVDSGVIAGDLHIPPEPKGLVIFSHGSGSSRLSARNQHVARELQYQSFATLLFDLLTPEEDQDYENRFNFPLLTRRLVMVTNDVKEYYGMSDLPIGYFGASTGAASALAAAAQLPDLIKAVVSRGGRPDMAEKDLAVVQAPTLLIVGGLDTQVIELNYRAFEKMHCIKELMTVQGAGHLFEEKGKLEDVAKAAIEWFNKYLK